MLWLVSAGCCALSFATFIAVFALWRMLPNKAHDRQARRLRCTDIRLRSMRHDVVHMLYGSDIANMVASAAFAL